MNDPTVTALMPTIRTWVALPLEQAKDEMRRHMIIDGNFPSLDFELLNASESVDEAIGVIFGVDAT